MLADGSPDDPGWDGAIRPITVVGDTERSIVVDQRGQSGARMAGAWTTTTADISALAGQDVRILVEAVDSGRESLFEAGVDDIEIVEQ